MICTRYCSIGGIGLRGAHLRRLRSHSLSQARIIHDRIQYKLVIRYRKCAVYIHMLPHRITITVAYQKSHSIPCYITINNTHLCIIKMNQVIIRWQLHSCSEQLNMWTEYGDSEEEFPNEMQYLEKGCWNRLRRFVGSGCGFNDEKMEKIGGMEWPRVQLLDLSENLLTEVGVLAVLGKNQWPSLKNLNLSQNNIANHSISIILNRFHPQLEYLKLANTKLTAVGLKNIPEYKFPHLKQLYLEKNSIGVAGVKLLVKTQMPKLEALGLGLCEIGDQGIRYLAKHSWPSLQHLNLSNNSSNPTILSYFSAYNAKNLKSLQLANEITINIEMLNLWTLEVEGVRGLQIYCVTGYGFMGGLIWEALGERFVAEAKRREGQHGEERQERQRQEEMEEMQKRQQ